MRKNENGMFSPYRVLDLADDKGFLCGKILGDLGADVIKIEKPGGDSARSIGPFHHDELDPEKSLFWFAFNTSKRGITLDIEKIDGKEIFKKLVKSADFVIESFPLGYMDKLGLGYSALEKVNPRVIMASITPFGQTGPYKDYKISDIVAWSMSNHMSRYANEERAPVRISHHSQAYLHAGLQAALGATIALFHRKLTGEGQLVDVSIRLSCIPITRRDANLVMRTNLPQIWPCKDGYVLYLFHMGALATAFTLPLIKYMDIEGMADDFLKNTDWPSIDLAKVPQEEQDNMLDNIRESLGKFFLAHTKKEIFEAAIKHHVILLPVAGTDDILTNEQLIGRGFWNALEHPELGTSIKYPGDFIYASETPPRMSRRPPLIGEHNYEIYEKELGLSQDELLTLKQAKVI